MKQAYKNFFLITIAQVLLTIAVYAQPLSHLISKDTLYSAVYSNSDFYFAGKALNYNFINAYASHSFIDESLKQQVYDKLSSLNNVGYHAQNSIGYLHKHGNWAWHIELENYAHSAATFSSDMFRLYFGGNAQFKGLMASIDGFAFNSVQYQSVGAGVIYHHHNDDAYWQLAITPSLIKGQTTYVANGAGSLYTSNIADSLFMNVKVAAQLSDTSSKKIDAWNGTGISTQLFFKGGYEKVWWLSIHLAQLGNISWNSSSTKLQIDTTYAYTGLYIDNLLDSITLPISGTEQYRSDLLGYSQSKFTTKLPTLLQVQAAKYVAGQRLQIGAGVRKIWDNVAAAQLHAFVTYALNGNNDITLTYFSDGYKPYNIAVSSRIHIRKFLFAPSINYIEELVRGKSATAAGLSFFAAYKF